MNFKYYKTERMVGLIVVLTILFNSLSHWIISLLNFSKLAVEINENIHVFSTLSFLILTMLFLNFVGWKWKILNWLIDIPNLNGRYFGELTSSFTDSDGKKKIMDCVIEIKQTASSIHVFSYYGDKGSGIQSSRAYSVSEQIIKENNGLFKIYYIFTNEPDTLQTQLNNHEGTANFRYYPDVKVLDGSYYNLRKNIGTIKVKFAQKKRLGRLVK